MKGMVMIMRKRIMAMMLATIFIVSALTGCSKGNEKQGEVAKTKEELENKSSDKDKKEEAISEKGRYIEKEVTFPKDGGMILSAITSEEGKIEIYTQVYDKNDKPNYLKYIWDGKETFTKKEVPWINENMSSSASNVQVIWGNDGRRYAFWEDYSDNSSKSMIVKASKDETKGEIVSIPAFMKEIKYEKTNELNTKMFPRIGKLAVFENGDIAVSEYGEEEGIRIFSGEDPSLLLNTIKAKSSAFTVNGSRLVAVNSSLNKVLVYNNESQSMESETSFVMDSDPYQWRLFQISEEGTTYLANKEGIHRLEKGGTLWETVVDGSLTSLGLPSAVGIELQLIKGEKESFFVCNSENHVFLYEYDSTVSSIPEKELSVYSLWEDKNIRQAMVDFQRSHTDVKVNYMVAMKEDGESTSEYVRALNTELLNGNGADILLLDGLPTDSYIEKGVLEDLSSLIKPMIDSGELLKNIMDGYTKSEGIYKIPLRFSIPVFCGKEEAVREAETLSKLTAYAEKEKEPVFGSTSEKEFISLMMTAYPNEWLPDGKIEEGTLKTFLENINKISKASKMEFMKRNQYEDNRWNFKVDGLGVVDNTAQLGSEDFRNVMDTMLSFSVNKMINGTMEPFGTLFMPAGEIAMNKDAKEKELAKEFISLLLSKEMQSVELYNGFSVRDDVLTASLEEESEIAVAVSSEESEMISAEWPTKEERKQLGELARKLNTPFSIDETIRQMVVEDGAAYLLGKSSLEQAVSSIYSKVNTYMSE